MQRHARRKLSTSIPLIAVLGSIAAVGLALQIDGFRLHAARPFLLQQANTDSKLDDPLGDPPVYKELREAKLEAVGHVRNGRLRVDRLELELTDGDLYMLPPVGGRVTGAVFQGRGIVRCYPPDAVEHQQLKKFVEADYLEERFERLVLRFTDATGDRLREMVQTPIRSPAPGLKKANDLFDERRDELFEHQLLNPDSRVAADLIADAAGAGPSDERRYFLALVDGKKHGWFTMELEPRDLEEVGVYRYDRGHDLVDVWMGTHAVSDFDPATIGDPFAGFAIDPKSLGKKSDDIVGTDLGLPARLVHPDREGWTPQADVIAVDVDIALEDDGDTTADAALTVEALEALGVLRFQLSPFLEVTDARWRPPGDFFGPGDSASASAGPEGPAHRQPGRHETPGPPPRQPRWRGTPAPDSADPPGKPKTNDPSKPRSAAGDRLYFAQERRNRKMADDLHEPWVTVVLPRRVAAGEQFVVELAYKGKVVEKVRPTGDLILRDTLFWVPRHPETRRSRFTLTFRIPERYAIASGGDLIEERVEDDTRIIRRATREPVRSMSFNFGRFDVTDVNFDDVPPIMIYADRQHPGFAPGNREKTIQDLAGAIRTQRDYFGPFPFPSLLVTETPLYSGQAFPGFLLLSFQTFGELHTGEAELFRSHEVAHQWWGAAVDWEHYRDQWLSEGFAQYGAALYAHSGLQQEQQFRDMLTAWRHDVLGEVNIGQGLGLRHYGFRPEVIQKSDGSESGPLVAGYRLRSTKTPFDYRLLVYEKGAFILHMLRMMLMDLETGDDRRFRDLMRGFAATHMHAVASTRSFETAVSEMFGEPMDWFFDQWVYGIGVPTYRPDLKVSTATGGELPYVLRGTIVQQDVPDDFRMPVPLYLRFADRPPFATRIWVDAETVNVELPLPSKPTAVEFNYLDAVLARVR